jgi:hypothetical protein
MRPSTILAYAAADYEAEDFDDPYNSYADEEQEN